MFQSGFTALFLSHLSHSERCCWNADALRKVLGPLWLEDIPLAYPGWLFEEARLTPELRAAIKSEIARWLRLEGRPALKTGLIPCELRP